MQAPNSSRDGCRRTGRKSGKCPTALRRLGRWHTVGILPFHHSCSGKHARVAIDARPTTADILFIEFGCNFDKP
jgi:hypothetical protein